jgi:RNA polymerase sigma-70 factor (sigma-E family)
MSDATVGLSGRVTVVRGRSTGLRATDEQEYTEYVTARMPALRRLAFQLVGDTHRADDVVQVAITRLYQHWHKAQAATNLDAYVRRIVVRSFLNSNRLGWSRVRLVGAPADTPMLGPSHGPDIETREEVRAALATVPPKARAVLVLRFLHDLPVAEVATMLGCSEGNVKSQTSHGLAALRRALDTQPLVDSGKG